MSKEINLTSFYVDLNKFGQNGEYERALKVANKIIQQAPDEEKAINCKIICLIQLSRFNDGLKTINNTKLQSKFIFEKAYCQYRLNLIKDALNTVNLETDPSLKIKELKAQILYRLERYEECFDVYRDVIKNSNDDYEDERETNLSAVVANLSIGKSNINLPQLREDTYELSYNAACKLIGQANYIEAEKKLKVTEKLCRENQEEDATEEEIDEELGIIKVQLAYCMQMQGREKEARAIYMDTLKKKPDDIGLIAIASNNLITLNKDQNVFDSKKKMKSATVDGLEHKLTSRQRKNIALNQLLLSLLTSQNDQIANQCDRLLKPYPDLKAEVTLIKAVVLARDGKAREAATLLEKESSQLTDKETALNMKLAAIQLLLAQGERKESCRILRDLGDATFKPGIVSSLVTLCMADGDREGASRVLRDAVDWYRSNKESPGNLSAMWRQAADFHLRAGESEVAAKSLEELLRINPNDNKTLAQLVIAYAKFDQRKAQVLSKQLPSINLDSSEVDALETSNWTTSAKKLIRGPAARVEPSPKPGGDELLQRRLKRRKRKGHLPKNYDPNVPPDPERWLPRHERTGYRRKKDRRNKDIGKGTQGAATSASDMYDITKMPSQTKNSPNVQNSPQENPGPRQQRKVQQKKKKKGGKW